MENIEKVWNIELEILKEVDKLCKKFGIPYFADSGTLLGAVRHKGFIPWDDDIDLVMLRKDYNRFKKIGKRYLPKTLFLQSGYNDKGFYGGMLHIRKNGTTALLKSNYPHAKFHQGIFIDIFPLDGIFENKILFSIQKFVKKSLITIMWYKNNLYKIKFSLKYLVLLLPSLLPQKVLFFLYEKNCSLKSVKNAKYVDKISYLRRTDKLIKIKKDSYLDSKLLPFNDFMMPVPIEYDTILTQSYGKEYMFPQQVSSDHGNVFFDTEHSYKDYLEGKLKIPEEYAFQCQNQ